MGQSYYGAKASGTLVRRGTETGDIFSDLISGVNSIGKTISGADLKEKRLEAAAEAERTKQAEFAVQLAQLQAANAVATQAPAGGGGVMDALKRPYGPLPLWGWLGLTGVAVVVVAWPRKR